MNARARRRPRNGHTKSAGAMACKACSPWDTPGTACGSKVSTSTGPPPTNAGAGEDQILDAVTQEKQRQELETLDGGLEDLLSHSVFANVYYEFKSSSPYTPYFGIGVGLSSTSLDYYGRFKRNDDPAAITTFLHPERKARLAGTTTVGRHKMNDLLTAYQAVVGVDYALSGNLGIGAKLRWSKFSEFNDEKPWTQLRSHASSVGRGFDVMYGITTSDLSMIGASLNMMYSF